MTPSDLAYVFIRVGALFLFAYSVSLLLASIVYLASDRDSLWEIVAYGSLAVSAVILRVRAKRLSER